MTVETLARKRPIELTVAKFLHFDSVTGATHPVPARLHCQLERGHDEAHIAFLQSPATTIAGPSGGCAGRTRSVVRCSGRTAGHRPELAAGRRRAR